MKIGYMGSLCEAPLHMAVEKGFFAEEGLQVDNCLPKMKEHMGEIYN